MQIRPYALVCAILCGVAHAGDQPDYPVTDQPVTVVSVEGTRYDQRRQDTASIIVVSHEDLQRYGDATLADALKRIPGISIGGSNDNARAGEIRLHGLGGGYTQILLNGVATPAGFTLESLSPELIERVEIVPTASAELGAQGIAGTINIILRKALAHPRQEIKLEVGEQDGQPASKLSGETAGAVEGVAYVVAGTLSQTRQETTTQYDATSSDGNPADALLRLTQQHQTNVTDNLSLTPRLAFNLTDDDSLTSQSFINTKHIVTAQSDQDTILLGEPSQYPYSSRQFDFESTMLRSDLNWTHDLGDNARFVLKTGISDSFRHSDFSFFGTDGSSYGSDLHLVQGDVVEYGITNAGSFNIPLASTHALTLGWDSAQSRRRESRVENDFSPATLLSMPSATQDDQYDGTITRGALFVQDDWCINATWSLSAGLRWESLRTTVKGNELASAQERSDVLSPLMQALYKLSPSDQLRLGLTRTYKEPTMANLIPRLYTVDNNNGPTNPDTQGNPTLRPELAWGLDVGYDHIIGKNGLVSASMFVRRIDDVISQQLFQEGTDWVTQPINAGRANVHGITFEAKFPLNALVGTAPPVDVRANLARNWSSVDSVPGPNNRLDQQTPVSANLGFDAHFPGKASVLGANFNFSSGGPVQITSQSKAYSVPVRTLDAYSLWTVDSHNRLRFTAANLLHQDKVMALSYAADGNSEQTTSTAHTVTMLRLTWEHQFAR